MHEIAALTVLGGGTAPFEHSGDEAIDPGGTIAVIVAPPGPLIHWSAHKSQHFVRALNRVGRSVFDKPPVSLCDQRHNEPITA